MAVNKVKMFEYEFLRELLGTFAKENKTLKKKKNIADYFRTNVE